MPQLLKVIFAMFVVSFSFLTFLVVESYRTGNFMASELPLETRAVVDAGFAAKLAHLGVRSVERASSRTLLLIEMKDGTQIRDSGVCAWNDAVEERGACTLFTSRSGRGYIFDVEAKSLRGDSSPAHWSKDRFLEWFDADIERVAQSVAKERVKAEARASWGVAAKKIDDVQPQVVQGDR